MAKILLVEDDLDLAKELTSWLENERHCVDHMDRIGNVREFLKTYPYDLMILDWELPDGSGPVLCKEIVADGSQLPILMLTARTQTIDRITGLDAGPLDYVCKPCLPEEISARIRALLRRQDQPIEALTYGDTIIDGAAKTIQVGPHFLKLSPIEFEIMFVLASKPGVILSPENIIDRCRTHFSKLSRSSLKVYLSRTKSKYLELNLEFPIEWKEYGYTFKRAENP